MCSEKPTSNHKFYKLNFSTEIFLLQINEIRGLVIGFDFSSSILLLR